MGGNVFKDEPYTMRINKVDVVSTVEWLEKLTGLSLIDNMLGTTGKSETSGDIDVAVDASKIDKQNLVKMLINIGILDSNIKKSGDNVHLRTPINGMQGNGFVQTDFMFGDPKWQHFSMMGGQEDSPFTGMHRHLLLSSIAHANGMKWSYKNGLVHRGTNEEISKDPADIAKILFNGCADDLIDVESIINKIFGCDDYDTLVSQFISDISRDPVEGKHGIPISE